MDFHRVRRRQNGGNLHHERDNVRQAGTRQADRVRRRAALRRERLMAVESTLSGPIGADTIRAARIVESVVGNAWATDAEGRFTYVTPAALSYLNLTLHELNTWAGDKEAFGWKRVVHPEDYGAAAAEWRRCLETGDHYNVEHRLLRATGVYGWGRCSGLPMRNGQGCIIGWYGAVIDRDSPSPVQRPPASLAEDNQKEVGRCDGLREELIHPQDRGAVSQAIARAFWSGIPQITSYRARQQDGDYQWTEFRAEPGYGVSVDVDPLVISREERWTTADFLGETAEAVRAAKVVETLHGAAFAFDAVGKFTYATPIAQTSIAMTLEDLNRPLDDRSFIEGGDLGWKLGVHPEDYDGAARHLRHCMRTGEPFNHEYRVLRAGGQYVWHRFAIRPTQDSQGRITGWYGIGFDIDVYKKTEEALRERAHELSQLVDMIPSHVWRLTADGEPTFFNKRMQDYLGMDAAETGRPGLSRLEALTQTVHPDDALKFGAEIRHSLATGEPFALRYRLRRADGVYHWMSSRAEPLRDQNGRIIQWYGLCHDVDDQMKAQEALRERERELSQLVETLPAMIDCATPDGEPVYRSRQLRQYLGYDLEDLDGAGKTRLAGTLEAGVHPDDLPGVKERYAHSLATGEPYLRKHRLRRNDGQYRWVETRAAAMRNKAGEIVQWNLICLDIDGEVRAQEDLRLAQEKMARASQAASLAELSASIAHEVNQPLAAVVANSHACQRWLNSEPPNLERAQRTVERIIRDANAAADVVSRIRALFKRSSDGRIPASLGDIVIEASGLMSEEALRRRMRVDVEVAKGLPHVALDRIQVQQVLINLIRNGMDAMENCEGDAALTVRVRRMKDALCAEVSDVGGGIESPERVFEPFYTTKENGMGMGLAICRSIIEAHSGRLWAEKNEPCGTRFIFTVPLDEKASP